MTPTSTDDNRSNDGRRIIDDDENGSIFSELRMSSIPSSNYSQNDAKLPPP